MELQFMPNRVVIPRRMSELGFHNTDPDAISRLTAALIAERMAAQNAAISDPTRTPSLKMPVKKQWIFLSDGRRADSEV